MPGPKKPEEPTIDRSAVNDINERPLSNLPKEKPIKITQNGKLVDPTEVSIESNPLSDLPE